MNRANFRVLNLTRGSVLASSVWEASSFGRRLLGLLGRSNLKKGEGLHLTPCNAVHMWFMRFPIDAVFLDSGLKVVKVLTLRPWEVSSIYKEAVSVLEVASSIAVASGTTEGDQLRFEIPGTAPTPL